MKNFIEDVIDLIFDNIEELVVFLLLSIGLILVLSLPISIFCDFYTKNRALDIYEETGVMITIDSKDIVDMTDVVK